MSERAKSTSGYAEEAEALVRQYEAIRFEDVAGWYLPLLPPAPARVLEVGAGTGRDAAGLAAMGHRVLAVEPTVELRTRAAALHSSPAIEWLDDALPDLGRVRGRGEAFDAITLSAVWMHLDVEERRRAMEGVAGFLHPGGLVALTLRHGPVPPGRRMFEVTGEEVIRLAAGHGLLPLLHEGGVLGVQRRPGVTWTRLALRKGVTPQDGAEFTPSGTEGERQAAARVGRVPRSGLKPSGARVAPVSQR